MDLLPLSQLKGKFVVRFERNAKGSMGDSPSASFGEGSSAIGTSGGGAPSINGASSTGECSFVEVIITGKRSSIGTNWSQIIGDDKLTYQKPMVKDGKWIVHLPATVSENTSKIWENNLVAQLLGRLQSLLKFRMLPIFYGEGKPRSQ